MGSMPLTTPKSIDAVQRGEFKVPITAEVINTQAPGEPNLTIDPNDRAYPFKGRGDMGMSVSLHPNKNLTFWRYG